MYAELPWRSAGTYNGFVWVGDPVERFLGEIKLSDFKHDLRDIGIRTAEHLVSLAYVCHSDRAVYEFKDTLGLCFEFINKEHEDVVRQDLFIKSEFYWGEDLGRYKNWPRAARFDVLVEHLRRFARPTQ